MTLLASLLVGSFALEAVPASAQDALICRKRDEMGGTKGETRHLGAGNDYFNSGPGPDRLFGGPGDDILNGGRGDDVVHGGPGNDIVCGGIGPDTVHGDAGRDEVYGEEGDDQAKGGSGKDYIAGQAGKDRLIGFGRSKGRPVADGRDFLEGSYLPDVLLLGGADAAFGGIDEDVLRSMTPRIGARIMSGGLDADRITGSKADDRIVDSNGNNVIRARDGDDVVTGGNQAEVVYGGGGDDLIRGVRGNDQLFGLAGQDFCSGSHDAFLDPTCERTVVINPNPRENPPSKPAAPFQGPPPIAAVAGVCKSQQLSRWAIDSFPSGSSTEVLVRYSTKAKYSSVRAHDRHFNFYFSRGAAGRETAWFAAPMPRPRTFVGGSVSCWDPREWSVQFYDPPTAPVSFPGSTMPGDDPMELLFRVPASGSYVADVVMSSGTLNVRRSPAASQAFHRSGTYPLGTLQPGVVQRLSLDALGEEQARWTIRIRPA